MSLAEFMALRVETPTLFHFQVSLSSGYFFEFSGQRDKYYAVDLLERDGSYTGLTGYIPKGSDSAENLFQVIRDGRVYPATLKISYVKSKYDLTYSVLIHEVVSIGSWSIENKSAKANEIVMVSESKKSQDYSNDIDIELAATKADSYYEDTVEDA